MSDPAVDMVLGRIYIRSGASDKAIPVLSQLVVDQPEQPEPVNLLLQSLSAGAGGRREATSVLDAAVGLQPQFLPMLGRTLRAAASMDRCRRVPTQRAVERMPKNLELRTRLSAVLLSDGGDAQARPGARPAAAAPAPRAPRTCACST